MSGVSRRVRIELAYDGSAYAGWQLQSGEPTVQGVLEQALGRLAGDRTVRVRGAGRTDAGVHARGQVADGVLASALDDAGLTHALRRMLPADVRVLSVVTVPDEFDSRRHARGKSYRYRLDCSAAGDPFIARYALHHPAPLDRQRLERGLARLPGRRDWSGFAGAACTAEDRVRELTEARYEEPRPGEGWFVFSAGGFLNHMVRNLVGTLLEIGRGRMAPQRIDEILAQRNRDLAGPTAPAHGLCLWQVFYNEGLPGEVRRS